MRNHVTGEQIAVLEQAIEDDNIQKVVVGAVILQNKKVLLVKRVANDFMGGLVELPSGGVDSNETILEALVRESKEETSLDLTSIDYYLGGFGYKSGSGKKARQLNFVVTSTGETKLNPAEHDQYFWLSPTDAKFNELNISEQTRNVVRKALTLS